MTYVGTNGLILLGVLAVIFAVIVARVRRRLGMTVRFFFAAAAVFAIVVLILFAQQR